MDAILIRCMNSECRQPHLASFPNIELGSFVSHWKCSTCGTAYRILASTGGPVKIEMTLPDSEKWINVTPFAAGFVCAG